MQNIMLVIYIIVIASCVFAENTHSLVFDGSGDYVEVADDSILNPSSAITLEAWIKPASWGYFFWSNTIVGKENWGEGVEAGYVIRCGSNGILSTSLGVGSTDSPLKWGKAQTTPMLELEAWTHVAVTWDGSIISLYVNAELQETVACGGQLLYSVNPLRIADVSDLMGGHRYFHGLIDEVRIWSVCRSLSELESYMFLDVSGEDGLIGYWQFESGSGDVALDTSGNENNGVIYEAIWSTDVPLQGTLTTSTWGRIKAILD